MTTVTAMLRVGMTATVARHAASPVARARDHRVVFVIGGRNRDGPSLMILRPGTRRELEGLKGADLREQRCRKCWWWWRWKGKVESGRLADASVDGLMKANQQSKDSSMHRPQDE